MPSRGPSSHRTLTGFQRDAGRLLSAGLDALPRAVDAHGAWIDARLLISKRGAAIPLANYAADLQAPVRLTLRAGRPILGVRSASAGCLSAEPKAPDEEAGAFTVYYTPGAGDILRLELAE